MSKTYSELYKKHQLFLLELIRYNTEKGINFCDDYFLSKKFLTDLLEKSYKKESVLSDYLKWINSGSTIKLKVLLNNLNYYNEEYLSHFCAMSYLDSVISNYNPSNK